MSDEALLRHVEELAADERSATAALVAGLAEIDSRRLHLDAGYPSLFDFCVGRLRYSEGAAGRRVAAARAARARPEALAYLQDGALTLSTLCRVQPFLSGPKGEQALQRAVGLSRLKLEELVAELRQAQQDVEIAQAKDRDVPEVGLFDIASSGGARTDMDNTQARSPDIVRRTAPATVRFSFEAPVRLREKLERLGNLLAAKLKSRRLEELIEAAADTAIEVLDPSRQRSRAARAPSGVTRRVPRRVRIEVWRRDGGRCAYVAADGTRCSAERRLQYDHIHPWSMGGRSDDPANVRLLCRAHNLMLARRLFPAARRAAERPAPAG